MTRQLISELKENNQDFEFYPTTDEMLAEAYKAFDSVCGCHKSVLGIGCGTCNFKRYIERKGGSVDYFGIEKSDILIGKLPYDVFVLGTDFNNTTLIDKKVDFIFCNPPYSEYENWTNRIIREGNFKKAVLVIPERWKENPRIQASLKAASVTYIIENSFDFLHAERQARAKVDVVCFEKKIDEYHNKTPFDLWFEETFNVNQNEEKNCFEEKKEAVKNELVTANNKVEKLVSLYNADMNRLSSSFAAICSIDEKILNDIGVNYTGVKKALKTKIEGLKILYWRLVFDYLDEITERLTHKTRDALFSRFEKLNCVDFNESNIRSVVIWVIKNASDFYNRQLIEFYKSLSENTNVKPYKSNIKTFKKDRWRFYQGDDKYVLDYRIISGSLFESQLGWSGEFDSWNARGNKFVIDDLCAIARNLGFDVGSKEIANAFNEKFYIYMKNGEPLMEYKIYKNHNTHIKLNVEFAKAMNVEVGRLLGWIRDKSDIAKEFPDDLAKGAEKYFNSSFGLIGTDIKLLSVNP